MSLLYGGIEAGGTKFVCAIGSGPDDIRAETRFATTTPEETIGKAIEFFVRNKRLGKLSGLGIASFGPVDPDPESSTFGYITTTPKEGWENTDFVGQMRAAFDLPIGFDTDVNGAALGEYRWGAAMGLDTFVYLTIGTGIGGGGMANGHLLHGMMHPEMGHLMLPRTEQEAGFEGVCPYHGHCLEGLASGPAIEARWGVPAHELPAEHEAWQLEAHYLALGLSSIVLILSPQRIILGGGVMGQTQLYPMIRRELKDVLAGYVRTPQLSTELDEYIVAPKLGARTGVLGAIALAQRAAASV